MKNKNIKIFSGIAIASFIVLCFFKIELLDAFAWSITISAFFERLYAKWLWRINPFEKTPRIYGKYKASIHSSYNGGTSYTSEIKIKQTLNSISVFEIMDDGHCDSITATLLSQNSDSKWFLYYTYITYPTKISDDDKHHGTSILCVESRDVLRGTYFTDRINQTRGTQNLELQRRFKRKQKTDKKSSQKPTS